MTQYKHLTRLRDSAWKMRTRIAAGTGLLGIAVASFMVLPSQAVSDITPMEMSDAYLSSSSTSSYPTDGSLTLTADFTDDLSGYFHVDYVYTSPSGGQTIEGYFGGTPVENTEHTYSAPINIRDYVESGVWRPTLTMYDQSGNVKVLTPTDLDVLNIDIDLTISGTQDINAPVVTSFTPSITTGDMTDNPINFSVELDFTEDLSGIGNCMVEIISPSGGQRIPGQLFLMDENTMLANLFVDQNGEAGTWSYRITMRDNAGNSRIYEAGDIATELSAQSTLEVTGTGDSAPPTITDIRYDVADPVIDEVPFGGAVITITADFADNMTGVQSSEITFSSPVSTQTATGYFAQIEGGLWRANVYLPVYSASGSWTPTLTIRDNVQNTVIKDSSTLVTEGYNLNFAVAKNITATVGNGGTVTSDVENNGATPGDIVEATVTTPVGGDVSIVMIDSPNINDNSNGYVFFGRQVSINAPVNTAEDPMLLTFRIDASVVPNGEDHTTLQVTKNGVIIPECVSAIADPDPCVGARATLGDGDIEVTIRTTTASVWSSGFASQTTAYPWEGFVQGTKNAPTFNKVKSGKVDTVTFDLGGNYGLNILAAGYPLSQKINCTTYQPIGAADSTSSQEGLQYKFGPNVYRYDWKTLSQWKNSCRQFILKFTDGSEHSAYYEFKN